MYIIRSRSGTNAIDSWEEEGGSVGSRLVPSLDGGTDGTSDNGQVQSERESPLVFLFYDEDRLLFGGELFLASEIIIIVRVLGHEGTFSKDRQVLYETLFVSKCFDIMHQLGPRDTIEWILDFGIQVPVDIDMIGSRDATLEFMDTLFVRLVPIFPQKVSVSNTSQGGY